MSDGKLDRSETYMFRATETGWIVEQPRQDAPSMFAVPERTWSAYLEALAKTGSSWAVLKLAALRAVWR